MKSSGNKLAVVAGLTSLLLGVNAVPSVDVAVRTAFTAPPYLVELL